MSRYYQLLKSLHFILHKLHNIVICTELIGVLLNFYSAAMVMKACVMLPYLLICK
jgi:hypothetical protein